MKTIKLQDAYFQFGNKGAVASNKTHIAKKGMDPNTLCGTPMLSTNWAEIEKHEEIGCPECLTIYGKPDSDDWKTMMDAMKYQADQLVTLPVIIPERYAEYMIDHFTNCLPPIIWGKDFVLCSEPYDWEKESGSDTYIGFYTKEGICYGVITTIAKFKKLK